MEFNTLIGVAKKPVFTGPPPPFGDMGHTWGFGTKCCRGFDNLTGPRG